MDAAPQPQDPTGLTRAEARRLLRHTSAAPAPAPESLSPASGHGAQGDPATAPIEDGTRTAHETTPDAGATLSAPALPAADPRPIGRPPEVIPTEAEARGLLSAYLKTNLNRKRGSMTVAARLFAQAPACSPELREAILREVGPARASKHQLPRTVKRAMQASQALVTYSRNPRDADVMLGHARGILRRHWSEDRRLYAGERFSFDDGSINFCVVVPWPWGGCRLSDKYGVKVGRFQFLPGLDDSCDFIPGYTYAIRASGAYRAEDVCGAMGRLFRDTVRPDRVVLERGTWEAARVTAFLDAAHVEVQRSYAPRQKLVENVFNRLWTILSATPGQVGRYRGEMERENKLLAAAQSGALDPREAFVSLEIAMAAIENAVRFHNSTPIESKQYGKWIPEVRWAEDLAAHPRAALDASLAYQWAPEVRTWTVRRGCVGGMVETPLGVTLPAHWWAPELLELDGRRVTVHFDPWEPGVPATLVLTDDWPVRGWRAGRVIASRVGCLEDLPAIADNAVRSLPTDEANAFERGRTMRAQLRAVVLREYRALGTAAQPARRESEVRGPSTEPLTTTPAESASAHSRTSESTIERSDSRRGATSLPPQRTERAARPDPTEEDMAELERLEARARNAGHIPSGYPDF